MSGDLARATSRTAIVRRSSIDEIVSRRRTVRQMTPTPFIQSLLTCCRSISLSTAPGHPHHTTPNCRPTRKCVYCGRFLLPLLPASINGRKRGIEQIGLAL